MTKKTFTNRLSQQTGLSQEDSRTVIDLIENHNIFSSSEKEEITKDITSKLGCGSAESDRIYSQIKKIIGAEIKSQTVKYIAGTAVAVIAGIIVLRHKKSSGTKES